MTDTILAPVMWVVAWIMNLIHKVLAFVGMSDGPGPAWVVAILGLTVVVRLLVLPLYNRQIRSSRQMQILQPEIKKIQKKYKGTLIGDYISYFLEKDRNLVEEKALYYGLQALLETSR